MIRPEFEVPPEPIELRPAPDRSWATTERAFALDAHVAICIALACLALGFAIAAFALALVAVNGVLP